MSEPVWSAFTETAFHDRLHDLIAGRPVHITLLHSDGQHLHEVFSVGIGRGAPTHIFDHVGGFYLVGEGITPDLLAPAHELFERYCRAQETLTEAERQNPIHVEYRSFAHHDRHRLCMHFPASIGKFHPPRV